ncbi:TonB-dependent receptor [Thalassotalea sp. PP2-459]|uniref:TonB-dependent receptor n=1 Tax=Thalassotalea sp. PP2-459 TaxID=1742724 RepID=UPI0009428A53|nr:TonB-dependent receptor [Thalassotalea sp. PP2-459]OKY27865.1 TonB-dependent receptor [Thalassotalea sp. PP2-459]
MKKQLSAISIMALSTHVLADVSGLEHFVVLGKRANLIGETMSASEGLVGYGDIERRPILRSGEILEFVPGMVVTQHSGSGKANQYFLRGFNLDHGTDFSTYIDGMPINMRTHGHGQGYADLNFITPEFIESIHYQKGPYQTAQGDFSTAGSAYFALKSDFINPFVTVELGQDSYRRGVIGQNIKTTDGNLAIGAEWQQYDGPWTDIDENINKKNVMLRYHQNILDGTLSLTFLGYQNSWNAADQIPTRAVKNQLIDELGSIDDTLGGESDRYSFSMNWRNQQWALSAYAIESSLNLYSNFTYFLDDQNNGDQFEQVDDRKIFGASVVKLFNQQQGNTHIHHSVGLDVRFDDINEVGLYKTNARKRLSTVRTDSVEQYSVSGFYQVNADINDNLSVNAGVRHDYMNVDVNSDLTINSGDNSDSITNFKAGLSYQFNEQWQTYANWGQSFHSNDARGATISIDPVTNEAAETVDLLVQGQGAEVGVRVAEYENYNASLSLWWLENDSELVFVGDAGNTEASRASKRYGAEFSGLYWLSSEIVADVELAWTKSRFTEDDVGEGNYIDGSLPFVASVGISWHINDSFNTSVRLRHFGKRTLDSFNHNQSDTFSVVNMNAQYLLSDWKFNVSVLNLFDSNDHDIDYLYESRLPGESETGEEDVHFHPIEPRTIRASVTYLF